MSDAAQDTAVVIVAAGSGARARRSDSEPAKQFRPLAGIPVVARTVALFREHPHIGRIVVVVQKNEEAILRSAIEDHMSEVEIAHGGATRQISVLNGLEYLADDPPRNVLIHDAVRPFFSSGLIDRIIDALHGNDAVLPALPVVDTLKRTDGSSQVIETIDRGNVWAAQTPQGFRYAAIRNAHGGAKEAGDTAFTDDASIAEWAGIPVRIIPGETNNIKLTTGDDFDRAEASLVHEKEKSRSLVRTGIGYDVHAFEAGANIMLGGVEIAHDRKLKGHSDADVVLHALTDALLGAIADGDIGAHFPPSDPQWKNASSDQFLIDAVKRVAARSGAICHLDVTVAAEEPKIGPHRDAMRASIAGICDLSIGRVSVKATTSERLGFVGRGEGVAAMAVATIELPEDAE